ncbi:acetate/propionate family kinase [Mucilaginibacter sp. JRF]|uniref:acetate/propionate family kinase n=1 Tax=Mucilaginibacter sp. JRF TaxID=2780088 RepID=UPI00188148FE|nr:acetate/propionate family kinase [Mucilaginibacter sp. JRF]MBE9586946.1 acetate/propionate family kinase [Mucilaginibacter sp. JRF]
MPATENVVLAINAGSSSVKFALYSLLDNEETLLFSGSLDTLETGTKQIKVKRNGLIDEKIIELSGDQKCGLTNSLISWLAEQPEFIRVTNIGHRIVFGMRHIHPEVVTPALINELRSLTDLDPEHLPAEIEIVELFIKRFPDVKQIACFDTMFHQSMPVVAKTSAIPRKYVEKGLQRFGFHGLSYKYLTEELARINHFPSSNSRVIMAHLGSGTSLTAIENGLSIDTSMGFTPCAGIPMSTRSGDLDPGVAAYFIRQEKLDPEQFHYLINHECGLLGVSETSGDIRKLLKIRNSDKRAEEAIDLFCYQISKYIGAYAAALGGLDTLVFSGGIGEHLPEIRTQICKKLEFLGIELHHDNNLKNKNIISAGKVCVRVIPTDEALMMARLITRNSFNNI